MRQAQISPRPAVSDWSQKALERTWRSLGALCFAIGIINTFIPLLPTTVFLLIGVWAYGKGHPAMRERLLNHPRYGQSLRLWVEKRQISRKGKIGAVVGITLSTACTAVMIGPKPILWCIAAGLTLLSLWLATRAEPSAAS
ncbi:MAG: YbaN family protein [Rugosibacter sp.]|nr:YbaN family protein [Rugosibacter sp.]